MSVRRLSAFVICALALVLCSAAPIALAASSYEVYSVQPGDTMASIAKRFGVEQSRIAEANGLAADAPVMPGQSLTVPLGPDTASNGKAQEAFSAEEKAAKDVETANLSIKPAVEARNGPVVGYLGIAIDDTTALADPRLKRRLCTIPHATSLCISSQWGDYYGVLMSDGALAWVPKKAVDVQRVELVAGIEVPVGAVGSRAIVEAAFRYYGLPYYYGGTPAGPTDCSGFVQAVYRDCGMQLPRTAATQFNVGYSVPVDQLAVGDRLYFINNDGYVGHTGIYIGNWQFIHASSRRGYVGIDSLMSGFYRRRLIGARRP
jgi:cell wall-associated NlpC family hydrolase